MSAGKYDALAVNRNLDLLAPGFRAGVEAAIRECNAAGLDAYVYEGYRSAELQAVYYARGRTVVPPAETVTNARTNLYSWHGYGLAVDVISRARGWKAGDEWFRRVAEVFLKHRCKWGGHWKKKDLPHFQWHLCRPSPSDRARELLRTGGMRAVWEAVGALDTAPAPAVLQPNAERLPGLPPGRILFERSVSGFRTVRGELVRRVQAGIARAGFDPGALDGVLGGETERGLASWQQSVGAATTGKVDAAAWQSLVGPALPSVFERALQVTAAFEGHGFGLVAGNFDNGWLTWGVIGFNLRYGSLGPMLKEIRRSHPQVFRAAFGGLEADLVRMLDADGGTKERWCNRISVGPRRHAVLPEWAAAFRRLGEAPEAQAVQLRYADAYWRIALRDADRFGLRTELGLGLCFDVAVQNGGIDGAEEDRIRRRLHARAPKGEQDVRVAIAHEVAENSRPRYVEDVRSRKLAFATGMGAVHGARYNLRSWGLDDAVAVD